AEGVATFTPPQGGSYRVVVSARNTQHATRNPQSAIRSSTWVWVSSDEYISWQRENNDRITLISDKSVYLPGETAEILIPSPFSGTYWAWVTVERGKVIHQEVLRLSSNSVVYRLPITADHVPNIYVSVVIVQGPQAPGADEPVPTHKVGYAVLTVKPLPQTLNITVVPGVTRAAPGDTVSFSVKAVDAAGEPVETFLSLDLVDKAVLSLKPRTPQAIVEAFYGRRGLGISTSSGLVPLLNRLLLEQLQEMEAVFTAHQMGMGGGGDALMPGMPAATVVAEVAYEVKGAEGRMPVLPPGVELREEFADTAFWDATVVTDRSGQATVELQLPDNLTTWVFRAVGVTLATEVGEATAELPVSKPLMVRPVAPRFLVVGDRAQLAALVSNNTDETLNTTVSLYVTGLALDPTRNTQYETTVTIPPHSETKVTWWVTVEDVAAANVMMSAVAGAYSDAARPRLTTGPEGTLLVHRYTAPEIVGTGGQLVGEDVRTEVVALPPRYDDRRGELAIRLDPSLAAGMVDGLEYLEHFPYECTEQTVSRFLPNVLTYRALQTLGIRNQELEEKLPGLVQEGLEKLYLQQNDDGGWGWWSDKESKPHLTAYVVFALVKAREAGFEVRSEVIEQGLAYLAGKLVGTRELRSYREANLQAFILYVMAEAGQVNRIAGYTRDLFEHREKLSHYGRAFLALTLSLADKNDPRISALLSDLQNSAILSATGAHWEEADYDWWAMNTDTRSTAIILDALARLDPQNQLIPNVVRWLMVARREGIWETTQETAWALIALTDWMVVTGELRGEYEYGVWLNDEPLASGAVTQDNVNTPVKLSVDVADLLADVGNRLTIGRGPGQGRLYYTAHLKVYLPVEEIEPLNRGIILARRYIAPDCTEGAKCPEINEAKVGETVQVHLTIIAPHDLYYVVVEDPLPAGAEPIDTGLETTGLTEEGPGLYEGAKEPFFWWWRWYSRSEMRDDKVVLFADYLPAGTYEYTYTFRATHPGEYRVIPTSAYEFYFPEVFGRSDGRLFTIQ
ncbi:MAG: alpha-2-macroglobulin, partial [Anaerolineae bacterium]|nr:alpha-2-macroglobulin [Anaerolineae bacterium]